MQPNQFWQSSLRDLQGLLALLWVPHLSSEMHLFVIDLTLTEVDDHNVSLASSLFRLD